jgi:hypothetical protein
MLLYFMYYNPFHNTWNRKVSYMVQKLSVRIISFVMLYFALIDHTENCDFVKLIINMQLWNLG